MEYGGFQIGVAPLKKKPIKNSKKSKKTYYKSIKVKSIVQRTNIFNRPSPLFNFSLQVSKSIQLKFDRINLLTMDISFPKLHIHKFTILSNMISIASKSIGSYFIIFNSWKPPPVVASYLQSQAQKELNEWKKVKYLFIGLLHLQRAMKLLIYRISVNKCISNLKNTFDIVTLDIPKNPIIVIDFKQKCSYVYSAYSLRKIIEQRILVSDYMFPNPQIPVNIISNQPFTYGQFISCIDQCFKYGQYSWILDRFRKCECNLKIFTMYFKSQLKLEAINTYFKTDTQDVKDTIIDFFESRADEADLPDYKIGGFRSLYALRPSSLYLMKWKQLAIKYYISIELKNTTELAYIDLESDALIKEAYNRF